MYRCGLFETRQTTSGSKKILGRSSNDRSVQGNAVMERRRPRQPPLRPLVLLADGHADTRELYATALRSLGFETTTVSYGGEAFAQAWRLRPDVIVTELSGPGFGSWELIRDVQRHPRTRDIPIVIVTGD